MVNLYAMTTTLNVKDDINNSLYLKALAEWQSSPVEDRETVLGLLAKVIIDRKNVIAAAQGDQDMATLCKGMGALGAAFDVLEYATCAGNSVVCL
jgi:acyl-CoA reductase-like NAD-dependent aldehyde dehydrogenase